MTDATLSAKVTADIADFNRKMGEIKGSIDNLGGATGSGIGHANKSLGEMHSQIGAIGKILSGGALVGLGRGLTAAVSQPLIDVGKSAVFTADQFARANMAFTTMLGSADKAKKFLQELQQIAVTTPFEFTQLQDASKRLLAMGIAVEKIPDMIVKIGDAVSGLGTGQQGFDRITTAIGQMNSKGKATAEEMKQFTEAGIGAWDALANAIGVSVPEAMEMVTKRQVDASTAITAIMAGMGERFGGLMEQQSATIEGRLSNLQDTTTMILAEVGQELITALKLPEVITAVGDFAQAFLGWFQSLDEGTKQVILIFTGTFAVGGPILVAMGAFMVAMATITAPMLTTGAIVLGIIAGVALIAANWKKIKDTGLSLWHSLTTTVKEYIDRMVAGVDAAIAKLGAIMDGVREKTEAVKGFFYDMWTAVTRRSYVPDMVSDIGRHMQMLDTVMVAPARNATVQTAKIFEGLQFTAEHAMSQVVSTINYSWGAATQSVSQALAQMTSKHIEWAQVGIQIGQQFLAAMINQIISLMTQWALAAAFGQATHTAMEAANVAATLTATGTMAAANTAAAGTSTAVWGAASTAIFGFFGAITAGFTALAAGLVTAVTAVGTFIAGVMTAVAELLADTIFGIPVAVVILGGVAALLGALAATDNLPGFAKGGITFGPALFGEAGPEAAIPLNSRGAAFMQDAFGFSGAGSGPVTINLHIDGRLAARAILPHLHKDMRRQHIGV